MVKILGSALILSTLGFLMACGSPTELDESNVRHLALQELTQGQEGIFHRYYSDLDSTRAVVRSAEGWEALWAPAPPRYTMPSVDFNVGMLIVAAAGRRPHGGWSIRVSDAFVRSDSLYVEVQERKGCVGTQLIVHPLHVVLAPRFDGPVSFLNGGTEHLSC